MHHKHKIFLIFLFFSIFVFYRAATFSEENAKIENTKDFQSPSPSFKITPLPQEIFFKEFNVTLDKNWDIVVDTSNEGYYFAAEELRRELYNNYNLSLPIKKISSVSQTKRIILGNPNRDEYIRSICLNRNIHIDKNFDEEGYLLEAFSDNIIIIVANSSNGIFYGAQTLRQLIKKDDGLIRAVGVKIRDWPNCKIRGIHFCGTKLFEMHDIIDKAASLKMNTVIFERDYWYDYDSKQLKDSLKYKELFEYCRKRHIQPIPGMQNFGIAFSFLERNPHCAEGAWVQDENFKFVNNIAQSVIPSDFPPVKNPSFEIDNNNDNIPDDWQFYTEQPKMPRNYWSWDNTTSHSGAHSVKVTMNNFGSSNPLVQALRVTPSTVYSLTFWAKKSPGSTGGYSIAMRIAQWDKNSKFIVENYFPIESETWKKHVFNFVAQPNCTIIHIAPGISNGIGIAWFDDIELKRMSGSLINVIRTKTSDIVITNLNKTKIYEKSIDYEIEDGDMRYCDYSKGDNYPYDFSKRSPTTIKRIPGGSIADSETVLVSYDLVLQFNPYLWKPPYCPSEPRTYEILFEILSALVNSSFVKDYIVIGDCEVFGMNRDSRCLKRGKTNAQLLAEDINKIYNYVHAIKQNVKILLYDDMLNPYHFGGQDTLGMVYGGRVKDKTSDAADLISKNITPIIWWFSSSDDKGKMKNSPNYYRSRGFEYLVATWYDEKNIKMWADILRERKDSLGMINTNWPDTPKDCDWKGLETTADYSWNYR